MDEFGRYLVKRSANYLGQDGRPTQIMMEDYLLDLLEDSDREVIQSWLDRDGSLVLEMTRLHGEMEEAFSADEIEALGRRIRGIIAEVRFDRLMESPFEIEDLESSEPSGKGTPESSPIAFRRIHFGYLFGVMLLFALLGIGAFDYKSGSQESRSSMFGLGPSQESPNRLGLGFGGGLALGPDFSISGGGDDDLENPMNDLIGIVARRRNNTSPSVIHTKLAKICERVNVRVRPTSESRRMFVADLGTVAKVGCPMYGWYRLKFFSGKVGWVRGDFLTPLESSDLDSRVSLRNRKSKTLRRVQTNRELDINMKRVAETEKRQPNATRNMRAKVRPTLQEVVENRSGATESGQGMPNNLSHPEDLSEHSREP